MENYEIRRLASLLQLNILDTEPEIQFDSIAQAAALACGTSAALITFIDAERQWAKANFGLPGFSNIAHKDGLCWHTILQDDILEIQDASADRRFAQNSLVIGGPAIRFYAGVPLKTSDGTSVGAICVMDQKPRRLDPAQTQILRLLGIATEKAIEGRNALQLERGLRKQVVASSTKKAESETRFLALCEALPIGVLEANKDGSVGYANEQYVRIHQASAEDALGFGWTARIHPDDRIKVLEHWRGVAEVGGIINLEYRIQLPDGTMRIVGLKASPIFDHAGNFKSYVGTMQDITESRGTREHLLSEQRRLANILECTGAGTWEWNFQTGEARLNDNAANMLGYTLAELGETTTQTLIDLFLPDDLQRAQMLLSEHFRNETPLYELEGRLRHRDGHWLWVLQRGRVLTRSPDGKPEWIFGTYLDITARKQNELALQRSDWLMRRTGEVAGVGGWEWDLTSGTINWTGYTHAIHGVPENFLPTLEIALNFYPPEARRILEPAIDRALTAGEPFDLELPFVKADGTAIWVRSVGTVEFENGHPVRLLGAFQDITEKHSLLTKLTEQYALLQVTLNSISDAVITTNSHGNISWINPVAERMTGCSNTEAIGKPVSLYLTLKDAENGSSVVNPVEKCLTTKRPVKLTKEIIVEGTSGQQWAIEVSTWPILGGGNEILGCVTTLHNVTEQRFLTKELAYRATRDILTGLLNRSEFERCLLELMSQNRLDKDYRALMYIDIDNFKLINDSLGRSIGDQIIVKISKLIAELTGPDSLCGRVGGDEFGVIIGASTPELVIDVANRICSFMDQYRFYSDGKKLRLSVSIGVVPIVEGNFDIVSIMGAADLACYAAKDAGRNQVHIWSETDDSLANRHRDMLWASRLEAALDHDHFVLYAQRIIPISGATDTLNAEILIRLKDDSGKIIAPGRFLPAAERFHLMSRIDRWVLSKVIENVKKLDDISKISNLSVNISAQSIEDPSFHNFAISLLNEAGLEICKRICLEITETVAITNFVNSALFIQSIRKLGLRVALDDFGSGASSFGYLRELQVDYIKIDGKFVKGMVRDPLDSLIVQSCIEAARLLGLKTVAEYVDSPVIFDCIKTSGVDFIQGYFAHRPEPFDDILRCKDIK